MITADANFLALLKKYDMQKLEHGAGPTFGLWADFRIAYLNRAWFRFAADNQGEPKISTEWGLGANLLQALPPQLIEFFRTRYLECLRSHRTWAYEYECSSPEKRRHFRQMVYPLGNSEGLLIINTLALEKPPPDRAAAEVNTPEAAPQDTIDFYRDPNGYLHQCSHCRMMKRVSPEERWDWIPEWSKRAPTNTSHTLCAFCLGYYESMVSW